MQCQDSYIGMAKYTAKSAFGKDLIVKMPSAGDNRVLSNVNYSVLIHSRMECR